MSTRPLFQGLAALTVTVVLATLPQPAAAQAEAAPPGSADNPHVVEVEAEDYAFRIPETLPAGWVTIRFENVGEEPHFMFFSHLLKGRTYDDYIIEAAEPFNQIWMQIRDGEITEEEAWALMEERVPAWAFEDVVPRGGPSIVEPGGTVETTVRLEPGNYAVECFMKSEDGEIHSVEGMTDPVTVTGEPSGASTPEADARVILSNDGIGVEGELTAGRRTLEVHMADQGPGFGHTVSLARLDDAANEQEVVEWMNWMTPHGLRAPAPATFIGGAHGMPVGERAYFSVDLEAGTYLLTSESGISTTFAVEP